jgi:hypothetical protein
MKKLVFLFLLALFSSVAFAQKPSTARVDKEGPFYIFFYSQPACEYEVLDTFNQAGMFQSDKAANKIKSCVSGAEVRVRRMKREANGLGLIITPEKAGNMQIKIVELDCGKEE